MKTITFFSWKGGSGRTTLSILFALEARREKVKKIAVIDITSEKTLFYYFDKIIKLDNLVAINAEPLELQGHLQRCKMDGIDYVFVDTYIEVASAICESDLIITPVSLSPVGLINLSSIQSIKKERVIVVNQVFTPLDMDDLRCASEMMESIMSYCKAKCIPLCPLFITNRSEFADVLTDGHFRPDDESLIEIGEVWAWIQSQKLV